MFSLGPAECKAAAGKAAAAELARRNSDVTAARAEIRARQAAVKAAEKELERAEKLVERARHERQDALRDCDLDP